MKTFRIHAEVITYAYLDVQADSMEKALEKAKEEHDGGDFISTDDGDFVIQESLTHEVTEEDE